MKSAKPNVLVCNSRLNNKFALYFYQKYNFGGKNATNCITVCPNLASIFDGLMDILLGGGDRPVATNGWTDQLLPITFVMYILFPPSCTASTMLHVTVPNCLVLLIFTVECVDFILIHSEPNIVLKIYIMYKVICK